MGIDKNSLDRELHQAVLNGLGLHEWYPRYPLVHGAPSQCLPGRVAVQEKPEQGDGGEKRPGAGRSSVEAAKPGSSEAAPAKRQPTPAAADRPPQAPTRAESPARRAAPAEQAGAPAVDPEGRTLRRCRYGDVLILMHGAIPFAEADEVPLLRDILRAANLHQALQAERPQMRRVELEAADIGGELAGFVEACLDDDAGQGLRVLMFSPLDAPEELTDHPNVLWAGALSDIARDPDAKRKLWQAISAKTAAG